MSDAKIRTLPTTIVTGYWDKDSSSEIPEEIKVVLADGTKARYRLAVEQPHPSFVKAIGSIRTGYRYGYIGKHAKK